MMRTVKLKDVIVRANTRVDKDNTDLLYYVAGEHIESDNIRIHQKGIIAGSTIGPMFYYGFKAGDFLLVSRNPHLHKAGLVNFDGICSEKTFVLETADSTILCSEYLPFVLQNEKFWNYAYEHRHGSTNTFINWSTLAEYEFVLPDVDKQRAIAKVLWSIVDTAEAYKRLLNSTDKLVKSQFIEMFGDPHTNPKKWSMQNLCDCCTITTGNTPSRAIPEYYGNYIEWIKTDNITSVSPFLSHAVECLSISGSKVGKIVLPGSLLMTCIAGGPNSIGSLAIVDRPVAFNQQINAITPKNLAPWFLYYQLILLRSDLLNLTNKALKCILTKGNLSTLKVIVPEQTLQNDFAAFVEQTDKSKFELEHALAELTTTYKQIIRENLG